MFFLKHKTASSLIAIWAISLGWMLNSAQAAQVMDNPKIVAFLSSSVPFARMKQIAKKEQVKYSFHQGLRSGLARGVKTPLLPYDFYYLSDKKAELYLAQAKNLVSILFERDAKGAIKPREERLELIKRIDSLLLTSAHECAKWVAPSLNKIKENFEESELKKAFTWNVAKLGRLPLDVEFADRTPLGHAYVGCRGYPVPFIRQKITHIRIRLASIIGIPGWILQDKDVLKGIIAHEAHHLMGFDALVVQGMRGIDKHKKAQQNEIDADRYANRVARDSCIGQIKCWTCMCELTKTWGVPSKPTDLYASPYDRLQSALSYARNYWKMSENECQKHIADGKKIIKDMENMVKAASKI